MTRLGDALSDLSAAGVTPPRRTSAIDMLAPAGALAPPAATEPADFLAELLTPEPVVGITDEDRRKVLALDRMKREKARHETAAKALGRDIEGLQTELIELAVELGLIDKRGRIALGAVDDGMGFMVNPYEVRTIWPKFREDPATDQPHTRDTLVEALRDNGLAHLVTVTTDQYGWPGYVRDRVKTWRQAAGQSGVTDDQGRFVDHDGEVLDADEARDPVADILALPRWLRRITEPVDKIALQFSRRAIVSPAVVESDAAEAAAEGGVTPAGD